MKLAAFTTLAAAATLAAAPAFANTPEARADVELTVRSGPSEFDAPIGVLAAGDTVTINGCIEGVTWCQINYGGETGWAYGQYLLIPEGEDNMVSLLSNPNEVNIATITVEDEDGTKANQNGAVFSGATLGTLIAYAAGGPAAGLAAGAAAGAIVGNETFEVDTDTITYVTQNPVDTVYLNGEVVVGAGLPDNVETYTIPNAAVTYLFINGLPVLVDPETNVIVDVLRS